MNIIFRVDSAIHIGSGHVMRCLTLAESLKKNQINVIFICREFEGNLCDFIEEKGFKVYRLPFIKASFEQNQDQIVPHEHWLGDSFENDANQTIQILSQFNEKPNWLIIDHYALDERWENKLRKFTNKIMVIDDLADRKHDCDVLLDQNYGAKAKNYQQYVPLSCRLLIGLDYVLLRDEFFKNHAASLSNRMNFDGVHQIIVNLGGIDKEDQTSDILKALNEIILLDNKIIKVIVVMGKNSPNKEKIKLLIKQLDLNVELIVNANNIAELMMKSDLAIGALGSSSWERIFLSLPTIAVIAAENQQKIACLLKQNNLVFLLDNSKSITVQLQKFIAKINIKFMNNYVKTCTNLIDGKSTERLISVLVD